MNCFNPIVYGVSGLKGIKIESAKNKLFEMKPQTSDQETWRPFFEEMYECTWYVWFNMIQDKVGFKRF